MSLSELEKRAADAEKQIEAMTARFERLEKSGGGGGGGGGGGVDADFKAHVLAKLQALRVHITQEAAAKAALEAENDKLKAQCERHEYRIKHIMRNWAASEDKADQA